jgi:hypothetical protein
MDKPAGTTTTSSASPATEGANAKPALAAAAPAAAGADDLAYDAPAAWTAAPNPSPMRKATFKIPKAGGDTEDGELAVSSAAGGVEANIKRWEGQFGDAKAKTEARTVNGLKVTMVEIRGKFSAGSMGPGAPAAAPKDNQVLLGAIVEAGDRQHFFKMWGGEKTMSAARKDFDKLVASFRAK